ncbi:MAG: hypothetical protein K2Q33_00830 [Gammaproteobacteria bacterium]|nr:hypothetical protein [Gammaproteobacteria bacterium]
MTMIKIIGMIFLSVMVIPLVKAASFDGTLHCLPNEVQFNTQGEMHLGAKGTAQRYFLVRNQYEEPLAIDFPEGHIGGTAGLTQVLGPRAWAVYVYQPNADGLRTEAGLKPPFWSCAKQDPSGEFKLADCHHSVWSCALSVDAAAKLLSVSYQQQAKGMSHSFWLPLGDIQYQSVYFLTDLQTGS